MRVHIDQTNGEILNRIVGRCVRKTESWLFGSRFPSDLGLGMVIALGLGGVAWLALCPQAGRSSDNELPSLDYFVGTATQLSFSEVENARNLLKADCLRSLSALQIELRAISDRRTRSQTGPISAERVIPDPIRLDEFVETIRNRIRDFEAVEEQCALYRELLLTLHAAGLHDLWLDTYLRLLYERPTLPVLARYADSAVKLAAETHRMLELRHAFELVTRVPLDFAGKSAIAALVQVLRCEGRAEVSPTHLPNETIRAKP